MRKDFSGSIGHGGSEPIDGCSQKYNRGTHSPVSGNCTGKGYGSGGKPRPEFGASKPGPQFGGGKFAK
jgi:hypothetical protein